MFYVRVRVALNVSFGIAFPSKIRMNIAQVFFIGVAAGADSAIGEIGYHVINRRLRAVSIEGMTHVGNDQDVNASNF